MELEQTQQKTYYDYRAYGPVYHVGEQVLIFFPTVKKGQTKKFTSFYRGPYKILEIINGLNFRVCHEETRKDINKHYDRMKKYKLWERIFTRMSRTLEHSETQQTDESGITDDDLIEVEIEQIGKLGKRERVANPDETQRSTESEQGPTASTSELKEPDGRARMKSCAEGVNKESVPLKTPQTKVTKPKSERKPPIVPQREKSTRI